MISRLFRNSNVAPEKTLAKRGILQERTGSEAVANGSAETVSDMEVHVRNRQVTLSEPIEPMLPTKARTMGMRSCFLKHSIFYPRSFTIATRGEGIGKK